MGKVKPDILHQDEHIVMVNKTPGLLSIPDRHDPTLPSLLGLLNQQFGKVYTVHRLDRETSGLLVFALQEEAHRELSRQFQQRTVEKRYLALLDGVVYHDTGTLDRPLAEHPTKPGRMIVAKKGKAAVSHYKVIERFKQFTLVEFHIETGRMHQIRVHAEALGHPLAIDEMYGRREAFFLSEVKQRGFQLGKDEEERPLMQRLTLHALRLTIDHPATGERTTFEAPLPKDFRAVLQQLRKWGH